MRPHPNTLAQLDAVPDHGLASVFLLGGLNLAALGGFGEYLWRPVTTRAAARSTSRAVSTTSVPPSPGHTP